LNNYKFVISSVAQRVGVGGVAPLEKISKGGPKDILTLVEKNLELN
jgi:hypothetical protein